MLCFWPFWLLVVWCLLLQFFKKWIPFSRRFKPFTVAASLQLFSVTEGAAVRSGCTAE